MIVRRLSLSTTDVLVIIVMAALLKNHATHALDGDIVALLFAIQHAALIICTMLHRPSRPSSPASPYSIGLAWSGTLLPLTMQANAPALTASLGTGIVALGSVLATLAILSLGRSFGLEPAHRGVQTRGLYRAVRHPIYAAYLLVVGGFVLTYPSLWNALIVLLWLGMQITRIHNEEALLRYDEHYCSYCFQVRYRIIPFIW